MKIEKLSISDLPELFKTYKEQYRYKHDGMDIIKLHHQDKGNATLIQGGGNGGLLIKTITDYIFSNMEPLVFPEIEEPDFSELLDM